MSTVVIAVTSDQHCGFRPLASDSQCSWSPCEGCKCGTRAGCSGCRCFRRERSEQCDRAQVAAPRYMLGSVARTARIAQAIRQPCNSHRPDFAAPGESTDPSRNLASLSQTSCSAAGLPVARQTLGIGRCVRDPSRLQGDASRSLRRPRGGPRDISSARAYSSLIADRVVAPHGLSPFVAIPTLLPEPWRSLGSAHSSRDPLRSSRSDVESRAPLGTSRIRVSTPCSGKRARSSPLHDGKTRQEASVDDRQRRSFPCSIPL